MAADAFVRLVLNLRLERKSCAVPRVRCAFSRALRPDSLGVLDLRRIPMTVDRMQYAVACIQSAEERIAKLHLAHCEVGRCPRSFASLCRFLKITVVPYVDLSYNVLDRQQLEVLVGALKQNEHIRVLRLRHMNVEGQPGGLCLGSLVQNNSSLCSLDLSLNRRLGIQGACELAQGLKTNKSLEEVNLNKCQLGDKAAADVVEALVGHPKLFKLVLSRNQLSLACLRSVARLLRCCGSHLQSLDLSCNSDLFGQIVYVPELDIAEEDQEQAKSHDRVTPEQDSTGCAFSKALQGHRALLELNVSYCDICGESAIPMFKALKENPSVQVLDVTCNRFGNAGCEALFDCISRMKNLREFRMDCSDASLYQLVQALAASQTLVKADNTNQTAPPHVRRNLICCIKKNKALKHIRLNSEKPMGHWVPMVARLVLSTPDAAIQASVLFQVFQELLPLNVGHETIN